MVDRQSGKAIAITFREDEQALRGSANSLRAEAATQMGASETPAVERCEVAVFEV